MEFITEIRNQYALSQKQLAIILGVSRPLITQAEKGNRSLPSAAFYKLFSLVDTPKKTATKTISENTKLHKRIEQEQQTVLKIFRQREKVCRHQAAGLQMKLDDMCSAYEKTTLWHSLLTQKLQETDLSDTSQRLSLDYQLDKAELNILKLGPSEQAKLRLKIQVLVAEAEICKKMCEKITC